MGCTEDLVAEHAAVLIALGILDAVSGRLEAGQPVDPGDLDEMLEFLGIFVDTCHHTKEERHLFPAISSAGDDRDRERVRMLLAEHDAAREQVRAMRAAVDRYKAGEPGAGKQIADAARAYGGLLRVHIRREDEDLFPSAEVLLPEEAQLEIGEAFDAVERDVVGEGRHEAFHEMLHRQRDRYLAAGARDGDARRPG